MKRSVFVPGSFTLDNFRPLFDSRKGSIEAKSGAHVRLAGRGTGTSEGEDLHVVIEAGDDRTLNTADSLIQDLFLLSPSDAPRTSNFSSTPPSNFSNFSSAPQSNSFSGHGGSTTSKTLHIPNDKVGLVIGRGGDTIKNIQAQTGANVQIAPESGQHQTTRPVTITGTADQLQLAEQEILRVCDTGDNRGIGGGRSGGPGLGYGGDCFTLNIPNNMVGLLIGKGGETIRQLQQQSGAHIQVTRDSEVAPGATERTVSISGTPDQIANARRQVEQLFEQQERERQSGIGGSGGESIHIPNGCVGMIIGRGGETIRNLIQRTGARIQISKDASTPEREVSLQGSPGEIRFAKQEIFALVAEAEARQGGQSSRSAQNQNQYGGGAYGANPYGGFGGAYGQPSYGAYGTPAQQPQADAKAEAAPGQDPAYQDPAYAAWAAQYYQYYGQAPPAYDPTTVQQQWAAYYQQMQQYSGQMQAGQQAPPQPPAQAAPAADTTNTTGTTEAQEPKSEPAETAEPAAATAAISEADAEFLAMMPDVPAAASGEQPSSDLPPGTE
jgi:far upstream element-binding protein